MVGLTLALALAQGGLKVIVADPVPPETALDASFRRAGERALLFLGADASGAGPLGRSGGRRATHQRHSRHRRRARPRAVAILAAFRFRRDRPADGPYRGEPAYPPGAVCGCGAREPRDAGDGGTLQSRKCAGWNSWATLSNGDKVHAKLAVAADGRESPMRERMGVGVIAWSYPQWGIVATVEHEHPHNGVAYEHFLPSGPFAILPMTRPQERSGRPKKPTARRSSGPSGGCRSDDDETCR